ncbi:MAG: S8 family peptidase, partial [Sedimentisphaerales bacterium]
MKAHQVSLSAVVALFIAGTYVQSTNGYAPLDEDNADPNAIRVNYGLRMTDFDLPLWSEGEIIARFHEEIAETDRYDVIQQHNCTVKDICVPADLYLLKIPEERTACEMVEILGRHESVEYTELNYRVWASLMPDDPYFSYQWNMDDPNHNSINMEAAWAIQTGDPNVVVAVLDTGVAYEDYDIYSRAPDLDQTHFVPGYDFVNDDEHPNDDEGHGTHVTGTIAQSTNNDLGVAGIAFGCSIMPVKVLDDDGSGSIFDIANGLYFAADNGAKVVNMSFGGEGDTSTLRDAVAYAFAHGVVLVCAAGNDFENGNPADYPAAYDDYCIAVGATRYDETRSFYSNTGSYLDIVAPGGDTSVDQNGDGYPDGVLQQTFDDDPNDFAYWFFQGTSMASPHVAGAAALVISNGVTDPNHVKEALEMTAKDLGAPGRDDIYGWGLLNV